MLTFEVFTYLFRSRYFITIIDAAEYLTELDLYFAIDLLLLFSSSYLLGKKDEECVRATVCVHMCAFILVFARVKE